MKPLERILREYFLDYVNNYLSVEKWAHDNRMTKEQALDILRVGRELHNAHCELVASFSKPMKGGQL